MKPRTHSGCASTDDRGQPCRLLPEVAKLYPQLPWEGWTEAPPRVRHARFAAWATTALGVAALWTGLTRPLAATSDIAAYTLTVSGIIIFGAGQAWHAIADAGAGRRYRATRYARTGYCPSCDYLLIRVPIADDGCTLCPECGSAWRLHLPHRPKP